MGLEEIGRLLQPGVFEHAVNNLECLDVEGNGITGSALSAMNLASPFECPLLCLNLSCNPFTSKGRMSLAQIVSLNRNLRQLSVSSCNFDLTCLVAFISGLRSNSALQLLYLDRPLLLNAGTDEVFSDHFGRVLAMQSCFLSDVSLRYCGLTNVGMRLIASSLMNNQSMISLNLECNKIGDIGAEAIATYLIRRHDSSLKSIGLSNNVIGNDGSVAISEVCLFNHWFEFVLISMDRH